MGQIGATFHARIGGVVGAGLFVQSRRHRRRRLSSPVSHPRPRNFYVYDDIRHALVGERSGETFRLGDKVEVKLVEAAPVAGALRFELLSEGRTRAGTKAAGTKAPGGRPFKAAPSGRPAGIRNAGTRHRGSRR